MVALSSVTPETWQTALNTPQGLKSIPHPHPVTLFLFFLLHPLLQFWGFLSLITSYVIFFQCARGSYFVTKPTGPWSRPLCKSGPLSVTCRKSCFLLHGCMQQSLSLPLTLLLTRHRGGAQETWVQTYICHPSLQDLLSPLAGLREVWPGTVLRAGACGCQS